MKKLQHTLPIVALLLGCPVADAGFKITDVTAIKNHVPDNPGLETFTPFLQEVDDNKDGLPEYVSIAFNVYASGVTKALFQTPLQSFAYPASPCVNQQSVNTENDLRVKFAAPKTMALLRTTKITCQESGSSAYLTKYFGVLYASDLSASGQNTWTKQFDEQIVATDVVSDFNKNNYSEIAVVTSDNNGHLTVYLLDGYTGLPVKPTKTYVSGPVN